MKSTRILINIMYIISVITTSPFYSRTRLFTHTLPPHTGSQSMLVSIFGNDKSIFAVEEVGAACQLATFSYFYLIVFTPGQYIINLASEHIMLKEEVSMFMSENICALVDLFDKAVAEGGGGGGDETKHCENEVATLRREIEI